MESLPISNSSYNFSPGLNPINFISISPKGLVSFFIVSPLNLIIFSAKEIILTGKVFSAQEAVKWNLANDVFPLSELLEKTIEKAEEISSKAPIAVRQAKQSIHKGLQMSLSDGLSFEIEAYNRTISTEDRREGVLAFNEKRKPVFKGK